MKTMRSVLVAGVVLLAAGCATSFKPWKLSEVQEGMSRSEIITVLGEPDYAVDKDGAEYLYYSYSEEPRGAGYDDLSEENIERRVEALSRSMIETKYEVILVDGKMINYKELSE